MSLLNSLVKRPSTEDEVQPLEWLLCQRKLMLPSSVSQRSIQTTMVQHSLGSIPIKHSCWHHCTQITQWNNLRTKMDSLQTWVLATRIKTSFLTFFSRIYLIIQCKIDSSENDKVGFIYCLAVTALFQIHGLKLLKLKTYPQLFHIRHQSCKFNIEIVH